MGKLACEVRNLSMLKGSPFMSETINLKFVVCDAIEFKFVNKQIARSLTMTLFSFGVPLSALQHVAQLCAFYVNK